VVHGTVPGFHTDPWVPGGLFCRQSVPGLRLWVEKNGEKLRRILYRAPRSHRKAVCWLWEERANVLLVQLRVEDDANHRYPWGHFCRFS
jgi:hypothetical protein